MLIRLALLIPLLLALTFGLIFLVSRDVIWLRRGVKVVAWTLGSMAIFLAILWAQQFRH